MASPCASQASALTPAFTRYKSSAAEPRSQQMTSLTATAFAMMMILITTSRRHQNSARNTRAAFAHVRTFVFHDSGSYWDLDPSVSLLLLSPTTRDWIPPSGVSKMLSSIHLKEPWRSTFAVAVRPSEGSSPSAASDTPPNITPPIAVNAAPPITVNAAPEAVARPLWTAPAAWRPAGRYVRTRSSPILGRGSHSEVVRVVDVLGGHVRARKRVAFVQAPPRSLWFEIEALTRLARHKGIAELIDVCYTAHKVDLIMPLYWGSLQELFDQADGRGLVTSLAKNLSLQLLDAMSFIHRQEIIHLDVTPSNILLTRDFTIKVADFGIAARVGQEGDMRTYGTLGYTAPECLLGSTRPTFQIDVWSTGCVIADLFIGLPLFAHSHDPTSSMQDILQFTGHQGGPVFARARFPPSVFGLPMDWISFDSDASNRLKDVDQDAAELIMKMLCLHPNGRPHLTTFTGHRLFTNEPLPNQVNPLLPRRE
ncbi:hypothetical protein CF327_g3432 [Tilletia walkeri]|nr:hypothetical protein CF327_g3432 [Tilletia walkeri]